MSAFSVSAGAGNANHCVLAGYKFSLLCHDHVIVMKIKFIDV